MTTTTTKYRVRALALALLSSVLTIPGSAQAQNAVITGRVTTESGQPVEAANLYITDLAVSIGSCGLTGRPSSSQAAKYFPSSDKTVRALRSTVPSSSD